MFSSPGSQVDRTETPVLAKTKSWELMKTSHLNNSLRVYAEILPGVSGM